MTMTELQNFMIKYGIVIRAIPKTETNLYLYNNSAWKDKYDKDIQNNIAELVEIDNRKYVRYTKTLSQGGKFIITEVRNSGTVVLDWFKDKNNKVKFYNSIEEAISDYILTNNIDSA